MPSATMECSSVVAAPGGWPCAYARTRRRHEHGIPWDPSGGVKEKSFPGPISRRIRVPELSSGTRFWHPI